MSEEDVDVRIDGQSKSFYDDQGDFKEQRSLSPSFGGGDGADDFVNIVSVP